MITEEDRQRTETEELQARKDWCKQVIEAAARYERIASNRDFIDIVKDMEKVIEAHKLEIDLYVKELSEENNLFKQMRIASVLRIHQIRKDQIMEAINYPKRIIFQANQAREELLKIKEQEKANGTQSV